MGVPAVGHKHQRGSPERKAVREEESGGTVAARKSYRRERGAGAAAPGVVDPSRGDAGRRDAGLAFVCTLTCKLAWLHVVHPIKGHQSAQAVREGLPCHPSAPAVVDVNKMCSWSHSASRSHCDSPPTCRPPTLLPRPPPPLPSPPPSLIISSLSQPLLPCPAPSSFLPSAPSCILPPTSPRPLPRCWPCVLAIV